MRKLLIGVVVVLVLLVVGLLVAPGFIPTDTYKEQIGGAVRDATGRDLTIGGAVRLSLVPRLALEVNDVNFANATGAAAADMVTLDQVVVQLQLMPLLGGEVQVERFLLMEPTIHLEVDRSGRGNWEFDTPPTEAPPESGEDTPAADGVGSLRDLSLGDVRLTRGRVTFSDARSGARYELADVNVEVSLPDLDSPFAATGSVVWNGQPIDVEIASDAPRALLEGAASPVKVKLTSERVALAFAGTLTRPEPLRAEGKVELDVPSVRALAAWVGHPIGSGGTGPGPLRINGALTVNDRNIAFQEARVQLDNMRATGEFSVNAGAPVPQLRGRLDVDTLDLNPYLPPAAAEDAAAAGTAQKPAEAAADWSDAPMDFSGLRVVNADLGLTVGGIVARDLKIGRSALQVVLRDGVLTADLTELALYGGTGQAHFTLDASGTAPAVQESFSVTGVDAKPLLTDAAGIDWIEGTMQMQSQTRARGGTQRDLIQHLGGRGHVKFTDGALSGINLGAMVRNVGSAFLDPGARQAQKTDFAELSGTFRIENGVVRNDDLLLLNPLIRLTGAGTVDLPARTVQYRLVPKVVATTQGQGGEAAKQGLAVPVLVEGPWHDVRYRPDLAGVVQETMNDPSAVVDQGKKTIEGLKEGLLGGLGLGESQQDTAGPPPDAPEEEPPPDPVETLKGLFNR